MLAAGFRSRRLDLFRSTFSINRKTRILDAGGYKGMADGFASASPALSGLNASITAMNLSGPVDVVGSVCEMPFTDRSFDIVFCNSVIEHVGTKEDQQRCAQEIRRVGKSYFVQTPNRWFPFELHWRFPLPLLHWLPRRFFDPSPRGTRNYSEPPLRILSERELKAMFPDAVIKREKFLGLTKSLIAIRTLQ